MGVWETDYFDVAACPCGEARIQRVVESPDNPWSRTSVRYDLACADCSKNWDVSSFDGTLTERSSLQASRAADAVRKETEAAVVEYLNSLLAAWPLPPFKTMAAEFEYLVVKGLYTGTIGKYRFARRSYSMREIAKVRPSSPLAPELIQKLGTTTKYDSLTGQAQVARQAADAKAKVVKRIHLPSQL
ncbi:hypothetical protein ACC721_25130 [Rhizobium ruizarguesonis]